jgi:hypothetical protein
VETVKYRLLGGGAGGFEHTRQPVLTVELSEYHVIGPVPNVKLAGPKGNPTPLKDTSVPAVLYILRKSQFASVEKAVAVMLLPMASEVGVMAHMNVANHPADAAGVSELPVK